MTSNIIPIIFKINNTIGMIKNTFNIINKIFISMKTLVSLFFVLEL